jgi:hypothetical protein
MGMALLVVIGTLTVIAVIVIAAIEARRQDKGEPSLLSRFDKKGDDTT